MISRLDLHRRRDPLCQIWFLYVQRGVYCSHTGDVVIPGAHV